MGCNNPIKLDVFRFVPCYLHLMIKTTCDFSLPCGIAKGCITRVLRVEHKNTLTGNFQKSGINTYTWNFGMYDTSSER